MDGDRYIIFGGALRTRRAFCQHSFSRVIAIERMLSTQSRASCDRKQSPNPTARQRELDVISHIPEFPRNFKVRIVLLRAFRNLLRGARFFGFTPFDTGLAKVDPPRADLRRRY